MNRIAIVILACAGLVSCGSDRIVEHDGVSVALKTWRQNRAGVEMHLVVKNSSGDDIVLRPTAGQASWAKLVGDLPTATVTAARWYNRTPEDRLSGVWSSAAIPGDEVIHASAREEIELRFAFQGNAPEDAAWKLALSVASAKHGPMELVVPGKP